MNKFKQSTVFHFPTAEYGRTIEGVDLKFTSADIDCLVSNTAHTLHSVLDAVAPLKKRASLL